MKKHRIIVLSTILITFSMFPGLGMAGNLKKVYLNVSKDGTPAQATDIPSNYSQIETQLKGFAYEPKGIFGKLNGNIQKEEDGYHFDGNTSYIGMGDQPSLSFPNNVFTMEFWVHPESQTGSWGVLGKRGGPWEYSIGVYNQSVIFVAWIPTGSNVYQTSTSVDVGKWTHFAWVADGTKAVLYKNGELVPNSTSTRGATYSMGDTSAPFTIGHGGYSGQMLYMKGKIRDVRMWNIARTESEIKEHMEKPLLGNENGLVGYWNLLQ